MTEPDVGVRRDRWQHPGPQLLQIPGPSNVPAEVREAIAQPPIDHRGPEFSDLLRRLLPRLKAVGGTSGEVVIYPSSGTGAWEAALVNTLAPGDHVLMVDNGHFAGLWAELAGRIGLVAELLESDWRSPIDPTVIERRLRADGRREIAAVAVVHNESSTGVTSSVADIRAAIDAADHHALFMVDAVSSLGAVEYHHDAWDVDVTVSASQKGLMLPPGLGLNLIGPRATAAASNGGSNRGYWDWRRVIEANESGRFPYTPNTNLLFGLDVALDQILSEGMPAVDRRHHELAAEARSAVESWGLEVFCASPDAYSATVTAVLVPPSFDTNMLLESARQAHGVVLGGGLGRLTGSTFRIGHLGDLDHARLSEALLAIEQSLPHV